MLRLLLTIILSGLVADVVFSQTDPLYAQYLNNPLVINPAYAGLNDNLDVSLTYRKQWAGFNGSPTTVNLSGHTSLTNNAMGIGLLIVKDAIGSNENTEINAVYSYRLRVHHTSIAFGLQGGIINYRSNNTALNPFDNSDLVFASNQNVVKPNIGAGFILRNERLFAGISVPRMLNVKGDFVNPSNPNEEITARLYSQHYYATLAYVFYLSERIRFKPSVLGRSVKGSPLSIDYNASVNIDDKYTVGLFTRNLNTCGILSQLKLSETMRFGYTFEVPSNKSVGMRYTTHEFCLGMNLAVLSFHKSAIANF